jgi:hypothetical protein
MNISRGIGLVRDFVHALNGYECLEMVNSPISRNVFKCTGHIQSLLYVKGRAEQPLRWGVTANIIKTLGSQEKPWAVVLLFESHDRGYYLTQREVEDRIGKIWPLGKDGDYKVSTGSYLSGVKTFYSLQAFLDCARAKAV